MRSPCWRSVSYTHLEVYKRQLLQGLFINPMADPQILGVSAGAGLGAAVVIAYGAFLGQIGVGVGAFIGGIVAVLTILFVTRGGRSAMSLILSGLALTSFLSAISFFIMVLNRNKMDQIMLWTMGGFTAVSWEKVLFLAPVAILGFFIALAFARNLNLISSGEEDAWHLGVDVERVRRSLLLLVAAMTAAAVSVSGMIGFVGLMVPHMVRILAGPDHRGLIPCSFCVGGVFLMLTDTDVYKRQLLRLCRRGRENLCHAGGRPSGKAPGRRCGGGLY